MKKGLINIILLVLVLTNVALTAVLVFAIVPAMNSTTELVGKVANAINLEKELKDQASDTLSIENRAIYTFSETSRVTLKQSDNGQTGYAQFTVSITGDKSDEDYSKYWSKLATYEPAMREEVTRVMSQYTREELNSNLEKVKIELRDAFRKLFDETTFIYSVGLNDYLAITQ